MSDAYMSRDIPLAMIDPDPDQPRQHINEETIAELAQSMHTNGLIVPIMVRPTGERFTIVHGERRWRAAKSLDWETIRAEIHDVGASEARWLALIENVQRQDLSPTEEARAFRKRLDEGITQTELGKRIGKSQSYVAQKLRLLTLPPPLQLILDRGGITEGHARQLLRIRNWYHDAKLELEPREDKDWEDEEIEVITLIVCLRPEDNPPFYPPLVQSSKDELLQDMAGEWWEWYMQGESEVESWALSALWWAMAVYVNNVSVSLLAKHLDLWHKRFLAALWWFGCFEEDYKPRNVPEEEKTPWEQINDLLWWHYQSDIRHAGSEGLLKSKAVVDDLESLGLLPRFIGQGRLDLPSALQPWGERHEDYHRLLEQCREVADGQ